ncbi:glycoside hydrolase family 2 TIM barrel-domain containing protein [uncultured Bacteroides sp.]|uniref:glycoside hydrolase family 2 protein n=1 Tax=uncultured Bacteroides sp. TaxID=162156 RepID=UPI0025ECB6F0|nr:glycoside hydrolase family 2 TIM barrel-domain containing protein [uncultured Bacteroides sp.]
MKKLLLTLLIILSAGITFAYEPEFSTAGFFRLDGTGREVFSMNPAWRFHKGNAEGAEAKDFDDKNWQVVSLPNGIEYLPTEASGCINYQGKVWYRKHFTPDSKLKGKKLFLHFEAIMGKSRIYVNGKLLKEHFGGFLPVIVDVTEALETGKDNVIAVWADNSDDPIYPPGKPQDMLDFSYLGGIYRDCWLIAHNNVFITDPNFENETAGGGLFVSYNNVSESSADVSLETHVRNSSGKSFSGSVEYVIFDKDGNSIAKSSKKISIGNGKAKHTSTGIKIEKPHLWGPDTPYLYQLHVLVKDKNGNTVDGYRRRIGIRSIEFKGKDGFWLNGKPYPYPLIGANRHQDFAVVGNAVPNSIHWRDTKKLRDTGMRVIRNAHYPQDPSFMDACDELGLFVIVNTPGWQFWNDAPVFAQRVYSDIRNMVRRDRNHPSVWMWEPILNETWYPEDFAKNVVDILHEEYPYPYCYAGCDVTARGSEFFPIHFTHPLNGGGGAFNTDKMNPEISYFTREWGDNVDDWSSHNSPSRVNRAWGEVPMLVQAQGYAKPEYKHTCYDILYKCDRQHMGGCLWHSFDHQRGYHPDPFYGGIMDVFRQPKLSYYMFCAQRPAEKNDMLISETGPMVYIANAMTPFSPKDITVYSNCDEVRLTYCKDGKVFTYKKDKEAKGMPSPIITFENVWNVMLDKKLARERRHADSYLLAEGLIDGKVVATHKVTPTRRPEQVRLRLDNEGMQLHADGSDKVTVIAEITDKNGNVKRLNNYYVRFFIEGEGSIVGGADIMANPVPVKWGSAPVLIQSTTKPGKIVITASVLFEGSQMPVSGKLELNSIAPEYPLIFSQDEENAEVKTVKTVTTGKSDAEIELEKLRRELNQLKLKEVEQQQTDFGEKRN